MSKSCDNAPASVPASRDWLAGCQGIQKANDEEYRVRISLTHAQESKTVRAIRIGRHV